MGGSTMGMILALSVDNTQAQMDMGEFGKTIERLGDSAAKGGQGMADGLKPGGDALLSSRESARLFTETLGIHLPRAVTGAIAEILPSIASMGTALIGVFAVKEVIAFGGELEKLADSYNDVKEAAQAMKGAEEENVKQMERAAKASTPGPDFENQHDSPSE